MAQAPQAASLGADRVSDVRRNHRPRPEPPNMSVDPPNRMNKITHATFWATFFNSGRSTRGAPSSQRGELNRYHRVNPTVVTIHQSTAVGYSNSTARDSAGLLVDDLVRPGRVREADTMRDEKVDVEIGKAVHPKRRTDALCPIGAVDPTPRFRPDNYSRFADAGGGGLAPAGVGQSHRHRTRRQ